MIGKLLNEEPHPNIVQQLAVVENFKEMKIFMEYVEGKNLFEWLLAENYLEGLPENKAQLLFK
jgi:serine/threonine protein kinase